MAWQKHRNRVWEGAREDLPQPPAHRGDDAGTGAACRGAASLGLETPKEGSFGQDSAAFLAGVVRKMNHRVEPKSNKQAQKCVGLESSRSRASLVYQELNGPSAPSVIPSCWDWCLRLPAQLPA